MRQRVTFIHKPGDAVDPDSLHVVGGTLTGPSLKAVREDRLTFALEELPRELQKILRESHELHIKWASPRPYETVSPLLSRLPPGLHLFYTPRDASVTESETLCRALRGIFGDTGCYTPKESFTALEQGRFTQSASLQYFQQIDSLVKFSDHAKKALCIPSDAACLSELGRLKEATSLDISYDTISHTLKLTLVSPYQEQRLHIASATGHRTEVGILAEDKPPNLEPFELGISGLLAVLGQDSKPSPTLFSFPSRHRHAEGSFRTKLLSPTGTHPTLQLTITSKRPPLEDSYCSPHAYFTLPRYIFPDKYQLADGLFLASKNLSALRYVSQPVDLEAPAYVMKPWGSAMLLELSPPADGANQPWTAEVPLHLRYLLPAEGGYRNRTIPYPAVFWACHAEEGTKFPTNPFERVNLGYDGLFGPRTVFFHVDPELGVSKLQNTITIPVLDASKAAWVNAGTAAAILFGFTWVLWKLFAGLIQLNKLPRTPSKKVPVNKKTR